MIPSKAGHLTKIIEFEALVAHGALESASITNKFGRNPDVDTTTTPEDVWGGGGIYTGFPDTTLETVSISSLDVNDTALGTGARQVTITGLDSNYNVQSETISLNGLTPSPGILRFRRVHTAQVTSAGSGGVNVGLLTMTHTTTTSNVFTTIQPGFNQSQNSSFTVPAGYSAYMRTLHGAIRGNAVAAADGYIWTRSFGSPFRIRRPFTITNAVPLDDYIYGGLRFTEKSDITIRISIVSVNNIDIVSGYDLLIVKNL